MKKLAVKFNYLFRGQREKERWRVFTLYNEHHNGIDLNGLVDAIEDLTDPVPAFRDRVVGVGLPVWRKIQKAQRVDIFATGLAIGSVAVCLIPRRSHV